MQEHTDIHTFNTVRRQKPHFAQGYALEIKGHNVTHFTILRKNVKNFNCRSNLFK